MNRVEAINKRCSRRTYIDKPIEKSKIRDIEEIIFKLNKEGNLSFEFIINNGKAFENVKKSYGLFKNVKNYIVVKGKKQEFLMEKMGYYGEQLVLEATILGLGTCWVGGTFDRQSCPCKVEEDEILYGLIAIGYVEENLSLKEKVISKISHRNTKSIEEMYESDENVPQWFINGMKAVQKAPSAINKQPVKFNYKKENVTAKVLGNSDGEVVDLGIAKLHFEIGSEGGHWEFGNGAAFIIYKNRG